MILKTFRGRELHVTTEVDWKYGRAVYVVDKVGTFTFERDPYGCIDDRRMQSLYIHYGRLEGDPWVSDDLPEAPIVYGVELTGACGFDPDNWLEYETRRRPHYLWNANRKGGGSAPDGTTKRVHEICMALLTDYLARDDYAAIEQARARYLAPKRLRKHTKRIGELRAEIAALQAELAVELAGADLQASMTVDGPAPVDAT